MKFKLTEIVKKEINPSFQEKVYDITVKKDHSYIANNIIVHNCTTSIATGVGVGQASIIRSIANHKHYNLEGKGPLIIADGGIKSPGDVCKALGLGADLVMVGSVFAGAEESPGRVIKVGNRKMKHLAGQASMYHKGQNQYVEGADVLVPYTGPVEKTWKAFEEGIRSGMSYMNCKTIDELVWLPDYNFVRLTDAAKAERQVHA